MTAAGVDWDEFERQLGALFTPSCDPYRISVAALMGIPLDEVTQDDRERVKRLFMRVTARRGEDARSESEQALRNVADMFHEIVSAHAAEDLNADCRNAVVAGKLRESLRSRDQIKKIATDGFELCVRALAEMGAPDVTIHECGEKALGEVSWNDGHD